MGNVEKFHFEGFEPANTTPVPDIFFDVLLPELSDAEVRVMLYIIRRTLGFKKSTDSISLNQFHRGITTRDGRVLDKGCGLKNRSAITKALASLEKKGCIESHKEKTEKGNSITTVYRIHFRSEGSASKGLPLMRQADHPGPPRGLPVVRKADPQETERQETVKQQTENKREEGEPSANPQEETSSLSFQQVKNDWYGFFDSLYQSKEGYPENFKAPRTPKNNEAIANLINMGMSFEQAGFVFDDIWNDPDPWWKKNRTISAVVSQFPVRIGKMSAAQETASAEQPKVIDEAYLHIYDRIKECLELLECEPGYCDQGARELAHSCHRHKFQASEEEFIALTNRAINVVKNKYPDTFTSMDAQDEFISEVYRRI